MGISYNVRRFQPGDEIRLIELLDLVFDGWPHLDLECRPLDHWRWKFEDNPYRTKIAPVAVSKDLIVGSNHGYPTRVKIFNKVYQSSQGTDLAVHPNYRRMGIYSKMSEFKTKLYEEENYAFTYAITSNPVVYKTNLEWGRRGFPHKISTLIHMKNIDLHLQEKKVKNATFVKLGVNIIKLIKIRHKITKKLQQKRNEQNYKIHDINKFNESFNDFWDEVKDNYDFIFERTVNYLNWRYCDPRGGKYNIKVAEKDGKYLGYVVLRINRYNKDYPEGYIVDLLTSPKRSDVVQSLIEESKRFFNDENINTIHYWIVNGHPYEELFKRAGFFDSRNVPYLILQNISLKKEWDELQKIPAHRLHYQYGDSDWI